MHVGYQLSHRASEMLGYGALGSSVHTTVQRMSPAVQTTMPAPMIPQASRSLRTAAARQMQKAAPAKSSALYR